MEEMVSNRRLTSADFWDGKRVLVTGHTGFKGGWLVLWLRQLGADVCGIALPPATKPNLFELARVAEGIDSYGDGSEDPHEAGWLALETAKSRVALGVQPIWNLAETVKRTMGWYRAQQAGADARTLCEAEIVAYEVPTLCDVAFSNPLFGAKSDTCNETGGGTQS